MPTVEFLSEITAPTELLLLMTYPGEEPLRQQLFGQHNVITALEMFPGDDDDDVTLRRRDVIAALDLPSRKDLRKAQADQTRRAMIAGDMLNSIYLMDRFGLNPSINRGVYAMQAYTATASYADGSQMVKSATAIRECWNEFSSVAHFWAAIRINQSYPYTDQQGVFTPKGFPVFLEVAAGLHNFATTFIPPRARPPVPIVDAEKAWACPAGVTPRKLSSTRFPDGLEKLLKGYKAPTPHIPGTGSR
jgi:hypothetical protein